MIRPLAYCENRDHVVDSLHTIDQRIAELIALKDLYLAKADALGEDSEAHLLTLETDCPHAQ